MIEPRDEAEELRWRWANGGAGICHTEACATETFGKGTRPVVCVLGGIGCPVDHLKVARGNLAELRRDATAMHKRLRRLREALIEARLMSLHEIRRAAFTPEIGVRYSEEIRLTIAAECTRLEDLVDEALQA